MPIVNKAERAAHKILESFDISTPPVAVEDIARRLGARLSFERFGPDVSGMLFRDGPNAVIGVNATHAKTRQRFTIAHEIGHLNLHEGRPMFVDRTVRIDRRDADASLGLDPEEIEANSFAAALLMPEDMILTAVTQSSIHLGATGTVEIIRRLANRFDVSPQAMEYRLANLGLVVPPQ
jgi:Zn-dependent peptidase ImmA (M78 family)